MNVQNISEIEEFDFESLSKEVVVTLCYKRKDSMS